MKKESVVMGVAGFVLGLVLGLILPGLFGAKVPQQGALPEAEQEQSQFDVQAPTPEQIDHIVKEYQKLIKEDPNNANAWLELGDTYYRGQKFSEAIESYQKTLELDPKSVGAYVQLGNVYYDTKQREKAIEHYQKALEFNPSMTDVRVDMAIMYRQSGQPDQAIAELRRVNKDDPNHAVALYNLGIILKNDKHDLAGAKEAWNKFLKIIPGGMQAEQVKKMIVELNTEMGAQQKNVAGGTP